MKKLLSAVLIISFLFSPNLFSFGPQKNKFSAGGGLLFGVPLQNLNGIGIGPQFRGKYHFTQRWAVEGSFSLELFTGGTKPLDLPFIFNGMYSFKTKNSKLFPYATAGLGIHIFTKGIGAKFGGNFGGGLEIFLKENLSVDTGIRFHLVADNLHYVNFLGGINYYFLK